MSEVHIMLDIETWGKRPGCDIRSIGAVRFDPRSGEVDYVTAGNTFYVACDNPDCYPSYQPRYPLTREPETVKWWSEQSAEALAKFADPVDLRDAFYRFANWLNDLTTEPTPASDQLLRIWANGPQFDVSILAAAYEAVKLPVPWHYRAPRDFRTVCDLAGITRDEMRTFDHGVAHDALDDAISQAKIVCSAYRLLGLATAAPDASEPDANG